jgi:hypothetical protein
VWGAGGGWAVDAQGMHSGWPAGQCVTPLRVTRAGARVLGGLTACADGTAHCKRNPTIYPHIHSQGERVRYAELWAQPAERLALFLASCTLKF